MNRQELGFRTEYNTLRCLENHDQARAAARFPSEASLAAWTALCYFMKGTTLIYAGQEFCDTHTPSLFEREPINRSGRDISAYLRKLWEIKKQLPTDAVFTVDTDDAQGIVFAAYNGPSGHAAGVFPLNGSGGSVSVPLADGVYPNALGGAPLTVRNGKAAVTETAIVLL